MAKKLCWTNPRSNFEGLERPDLVISRLVDKGSASGLVTSMRFNAVLILSKLAARFCRETARAARNSGSLHQ